MPDDIFVKILGMGMDASVVILAVILSRALLRKLPKKYSYFLWILVAFRLVCPISISSGFSAFNLIGIGNFSTVLTQEAQILNSAAADKDVAGGTAAGGVTADRAAVNGTAGDRNAAGNTAGSRNAAGNTAGDRNAAGGTAGDKAVTDGTAAGGTAEPRTTTNDTVADRVAAGNTVADRAAVNGAAANRAEIGKTAADIDVKKMPGPLSALWLAGILMMLCYQGYCYLRLRKKLARAVLLHENIYECEAIPTPFVMGIFRARIYIPFRLNENERKYIIRHEKYHIHRKDHLIKLVAVILTAIYWFHPLVWLSYGLMVRDMEMSCDEQVLLGSSPELKAAYCESLLNFAVNQREIGIGFIAFGESDTRRRVKNIMSNKKYGRWVGAAAVGLALVLGASCLTNANEQKKETAQNPVVEETSRKESKENVSQKEGNGKTSQKEGKEKTSRAEGKKEFVPVKKAEYELSDSVGVDFVEIKYIDSDRLIFSGSFGLFVFDRKNMKMFREVDLRPIGCDATQGEHYAEIFSSGDGKMVYLHSMGSKERYIYDVGKNQMEKLEYKKQEMDRIERFSSYEEMDVDGKTMYDYSTAYYLENGKKQTACLVSGDYTIGGLGLSLEQADPFYSSSLFLGEKYAGAKMFRKEEIKDIVKAEMFIGGKMQTETSKEKLNKLESLIQEAKPIKGFSACDFRTPMYLTTKAGKLGVIYPALDSCNAFITEEGEADLDGLVDENGLRGVLGWKTSREK